MDPDLFSASNVHRRDVCHASWGIESDIPAQPDSEWSLEGTMLHALFADPSLNRESWVDPKTGNKITITDEQRDTLELIERSSKKFVQENAPVDEKPIFIIERRVAFKVGSATIFTGKPDLVLFYPLAGILIVLDAKFGWDKVKAAVNNSQLAAYIAMLAQILKAKKYLGAILNRFGGIDSVSYTAVGLKAVEKRLMQIWKANKDNKDAPNPTPSGCQFCRGFITGKCPAIKNLPKEVGEWSVEIERHETSIVGYIRSFHPDQRDVIVDKMLLLKNLVEKWLPFIKEEVERDPKFLPKYTVSKGDKIRSVDDVATAMMILRKSSNILTADDIVESVKLSLPALARKIRKRNPGWTGVQAEEWVRSTLSTVIVETQKEGSLEREK